MCLHLHIGKPRSFSFIVILSTAAALEACAPVINPLQQPETVHINVNDFPPPGKSEDDHERDKAVCRNSNSNDAVAYAHCLMSLGYQVDLDMPHGYSLRTTSDPSRLYGSGPVVPLAETRTRLEAETPPAYQPPPTRESEEIQASIAPQVRESQGTFLTAEQKQKLIDVGKDEAKVALGACVVRRAFGGRHFFKCFAEHWMLGMAAAMGENYIRQAICKNPDILNLIPIITPDIKVEMVNDTACT